MGEGKGGEERKKEGEGGRERGEGNGTDVDPRLQLLDPPVRGAATGGAADSSPREYRVRSPPPGHRPAAAAAAAAATGGCGTAPHIADRPHGDHTSSPSCRRRRRPSRCAGAGPFFSRGRAPDRR